MYDLMMGDCLDLIKQIPDGSVDMVLCDLPYGTTRCAWDSIIPFEYLWPEYGRITKKGGAIVLTASQPFTTVMIASNMKNFAHSWVWNKRFAANFVQAKRQPLKDHEDVVVFSMDGKQPDYYPQMVKRDKPIIKGGNSQSNAIPIAITNASKAFGESVKSYDTKNPTTAGSLEFSVRDGRGLHPTQKPVALMEYLIRTYTHEGMTVLDNCAGSFTTGIACLNTGRRFIGIEKDPEYFRIGSERMHKRYDEIMALSVAAAPVSCDMTGSNKSSCKFGLPSLA